MTYSKNDLCNPRVALLETRMGSELATLVRKHGGDPVVVPSISERPADASADVARLIDRLCDGLVNIVVFQTGVSIKELVRVAETLGRTTGLIAGLRGVTKVCRGPKPAYELRHLGLGVDVMVPEPHTTGEMIATLSSIALEGSAIYVVHHGEPNADLIDVLASEPCQVDELVLYRWELPADIRPLWTLVTDIIGGRYAAVAFTSQVQARHLFQVAQESGLYSELQRALQDRTVVACVGPTCAAELARHGVQAGIEPDHPKMGHMVRDLAAHLSTRTGKRAGALIQVHPENRDDNRIYQL